MVCQTRRDFHTCILSPESGLSENFRHQRSGFLALTALSVGEAIFGSGRIN